MTTSRTAAPPAAKASGQGPALSAPGPFSTQLRLDLDGLETFIAIVELGSFSQAATRMHISQPSVTARLKKLEQRLGVQLLERTTRRVAPTREGGRLYQAASQALEGLRQVVGEFDGATGRGNPRIVVAATPMIAATTLPRLIHAYRQRFPEVRIQLLDLLYRDVIQQIESGGADLALVAFDGDSARLSYQPLAEEALLLVVPGQHPLARRRKILLAQALSWPLMVLDRYTQVASSIAEACRQRALALPQLTTASNLNTLLGMIDAGNGITFLPASMAQINAQRRRVTLQVSDFQLTRQYGILSRKNRELNGAAQGFVRHLQQHYAGSLAGAGADPEA